MAEGHEPGEVIQAVQSETACPTFCQQAVHTVLRASHVLFCEIMIGLFRRKLYVLKQAVPLGGGHARFLLKASCIYTGATMLAVGT